ncbi:MAG: hypothetical protein AB8I08_31300 [Sandaracinaceae bacterium]
MISTTLRRPLLCLCLFALGCGPTALRAGSGTGGTLSLGGQEARRIQTLTDLEEVRAVVRHAGLLYVATDAGLLRYPSIDAPGERVEGLPSEDVRGVVVEGETLLIATADGMVSLGAGDAATAVHGAPQLGHLMDMEATTDGTVWLCGLGGVARRAPGAAWEVLVETATCTDLAPTPEGQLWIGTTSGLWYVDGEVIREHPISGGMPEGYVREIVPVLPGQIMAILQGPNASQIGYWNGERWFGYTLPGLEDQVVGLVRRGTDVLLVSQDRVLILAPRGPGVPLRPLSANDGTVRSFRPSLVAASEHQAAASPGEEALKEPSRLAPIPENQPSIEAPPFRAAPLDMALPGRLYRAFVHEAEAFLAVSNGGVMHLGADGRSRVLRSLSIVPEEDLQVATDSSSTTWLLTRDGHLAKLINGRLRRSPLPEGRRAQALANGPQGGYLVTLDTETPNTLHVYTNAGRGWSPLMTRTLTLDTPLTAAPFAGVAPDGKVWVAIRVQREQGTGDRVRGVAVLDANDETIVYHHRGANREAGGLPLPDEITSIDFDTDGNAWFASLSGLVRVGSSQAVVFGEARGVRGEVVMDAAVGSSVIWLASAEGLGAYDRSSFDYAGQPAFVHAARPTHVAVDLAGHVWVASSTGLILHEGTEWVQIGQAEGLSNPDITDVEVDEAGRVWLLADDGLMLLTQ